MQFLLELKDEREKGFLLKLLSQLDFVQVLPNESADNSTDPESTVMAGLDLSEESHNGSADDEGDDFFADAGILAHWTVSAEDLKQKARGLKVK